MAPEPSAAELALENAALQAENARLKESLDACQQGHDKEQRLKTYLQRANTLLDSELFRSRLTEAVLKAAETGEDLAPFIEALFAFIGRVVRYRWVGLRLSGQGYSDTWHHPVDVEGFPHWLDAVARRETPADMPAGATFSYTFRRGDRVFGHLVCLAEDEALTPKELSILEDICRQASPILERNLLIRLMEQMAGYKEDFVNMLSHDLRNPLTGVISSLSTAMLPGLPLTSEEREELSRTALDSARLVNDMIGDLLDVAKLEAGRMAVSKDAVELEAIAEQAVQTLQSVARTRRLALVLDLEPDLPAVAGDGRKLLRVFSNLIANALKYTQRGGVVVRLRRVGDQVEGMVADTGFGIPPEAQGRLFEKFYQVGDSRSAKSGGTGLGLAFCRQMIEAHGGTIRVESPSNEAIASGLLPALPVPHADPGSAFRFTLPAR